MGRSKFKCNCHGRIFATVHSRQAHERRNSLGTEQEEEIVGGRHSEDKSSAVQGCRTTSKEAYNLKQGQPAVEALKLHHSQQTQTAGVRGETDSSPSEMPREVSDKAQTERG